MTGRLAVDFGTSNTVVTLWDNTSHDSHTLPLKDYTRIHDLGHESIFVTPSLVHYLEDYDKLFGNQVLTRNLYYSTRTFQWMKRFITGRNPIERRFNGRRINFFDAGKDFLVAILTEASQYMTSHDEEIALTVPVESFEDYSLWLSNVAHDAKVLRYRIIDEPTAAALGY